MSKNELIMSANGGRTIIKNTRFGKMIYIRVYGGRDEKYNSKDIPTNIPANARGKLKK